MANEDKLRELLEEYLGTDKFQESQVIGHKRNLLKGCMCAKAMLAHHKCVFSLCELCFGKYAVSRKDKKQEKFFASTMVTGIVMRQSTSQGILFQ